MRVRLAEGWGLSVMDLDQGGRAAFEVYAWGHGYVGARASLAEARLLAAEYEGARILTVQGGQFTVAAVTGRYLSERTAARPAVA